jgi:hypothetical protein
MRSRFWIIFDGAMLVAIAVLEPWRLTGLPIHEWLGIALGGAVVVHLLLHWSWVATQWRRRRVAYTLNVALFLSMIVAIVSGVAISKVAMPMHPMPSDYLKWHGIHEFFSRAALIAAALHLALNWDRLFIQRPRLRGFGRLAWIAIAIVIVGAATYGIERVQPAERVVAPDIVVLRPGTATPSMIGVPGFVVYSAIVVTVAVVGRKVLRLRL